MENKTGQADFGSEVLLIFVGHSDDSKVEVEAFRQIEGKLQRELEGLLKVAQLGKFKVIRIWDWNYDAALGVGGQATAVTPYIERANIALFIFKERIGKVTWDELLTFRNRADNRIPLIAVFPKAAPDRSRFNDINVVDNWSDLLKKKRELTSDWTEAGSTSLTPIEDYNDSEHLLEILFNRIRTLIPTLLSVPALNPTLPPLANEARFLGELKELSFDRRPVIGHSPAELDQALLQDFLAKPLSQDELRTSSGGSQTIEGQLRMLGLLQGVQISLGAFLCFAPRVLITNKFDSTSLHLVSYDGKTKAESKAQITKLRDNLLTLFTEGMGWLSSRSGLKRLGTVGTLERDQLEIPEVALREALANALVHRNYEKPEYRDQPTRIEVFEDRVEITSYGALLSSISVEQLNNDPESLAPMRRNPVIALIFNNMTHVELNASGISRMRLETQKALLPAPKIYAEKDFVRVVFTRRTLSAIESLNETEFPSLPTPTTRSLKSVFISSTVRDLPEHRREVMDACLRQGMFPVMMEHLPSSDEEIVMLSTKMIEQADVYLGVIAHRYGYVPRGQDMSIVEMEYNKAVERDIPRLIFIIGNDHLVEAAEVDTRDKAAHLETFKNRLRQENLVRSFSSPSDLRGAAIEALAKLRKPDLASFHYVSDIPSPPQAYVAHPYTLLQTSTLIGRQKELKLLTDWTTGKPLDVDGEKASGESVRFMSVVGIGGMGKSALTWKWFNDVAPQEMKNLAGRMWWSFYESDATFENFVIRALAYVTRRTIEKVTQMPASERETQLLVALDRHAFLLVLDGLERILIAYARIDAARIDESGFGREQNVRKAADPRVGSFLKKLTQVRASRTLVSSRLYPTELETSAGDPIPGSFRFSLEALPDDDAIELWRAFAVSGSREELLPLFKTFSSHPLLIQTLAGEVKRYRRAPGSFEEWRKAHPRFNPSQFDRLQDAFTHVMESSLGGLDEKTRKVLGVIAAFRMPTNFDTLASLLTGQGKPLGDEHELDQVLSELEDRGLVGWDKRSNRYDLHSIVRGVVWHGMRSETQRNLYSKLHTFFEELPQIDTRRRGISLEDLTPAIELYSTLIGLERYDDAAAFYQERLELALLYRLSATRHQIELLELLFPEGLDQLPKVRDHKTQALILHALAQAYQFSGHPSRAVVMYRRVNTIKGAIGDYEVLRASLASLAYTLRTAGAMREAEQNARTVLLMARKHNDRSREAASLNLLGWISAARGNVEDSDRALNRSLRLDRAHLNKQAEGVDNSFLAQRMLWLGKNELAKRFADRASSLAHTMGLERDFIRAARLQGETEGILGRLEIAQDRLHQALTRARNVNLAEEELPALVALAELRRRQGDAKAARELLDDVWESAERGPYPLFHADALNVLAQIDRDEGNNAAAVEAATEAYRLAWCDGPPFAYHWGLEKAKKHLKELGAPEPEMPPFDESKFEPMPVVEINPPDEFYVDEESVS